MSSKRVPFGTTPTANRPQPAAAATAEQTKIEQWVEGRKTAEPMKRFTLDVPASLHARIKATCALRGQKMNEVLLAMLEEEFPKEGRA